MKTRIIMTVIMLLSVLSMIALPITERVSADAWWGEGFRDKNWVLEHGGSIINYKIVGKENSDDYKARMYLGEKMMEIEYGGSAYFDDAINNTYKVIIFKGTKKEMSEVVTVRPGETVSLKFDLKKDKVSKSSVFIPKSQISLDSDSAKYVRQPDIRVAAPILKPVTKPQAVEPVPESVAVKIATEEAVLGVQTFDNESSADDVKEKTDNRTCLVPTENSYLIFPKLLQVLAL